MDERLKSIERLAHQGDRTATFKLNRLRERVHGFAAKNLLPGTIAIHDDIIHSTILIKVTELRYFDEPGCLWLENGTDQECPVYVRGMRKGNHRIFSMSATHCQSFNGYFGGDPGKAPFGAKYRTVKPNGNIAHNGWH